MLGRYYHKVVKKGPMCVKSVKLCNEQYFKKVRSIVAQLLISLKSYFTTAKYLYTHENLVSEERKPTH